MVDFIRVGTKCGGTIMERGLGGYRVVIPIYRIYRTRSKSNLHRATLLCLTCVSISFRTRVILSSPATTSHKRCVFLPTSLKDVSRRFMLASQMRTYIKSQQLSSVKNLASTLTVKPPRLLVL